MMLIFWSFHICSLRLYKTVEFLVHQTSLEGIAGYDHYLKINVSQLLLG